MIARLDLGGKDGLDARVLAPDDPSDGSPVVILMHGRGADPSDLEPLRRGLPADTTLVLPRAPHPGSPWGYGPGWAWYRYDGDTSPEPDSFSAAQVRLEGLLGALSRVVGFEPGPVILGGFSQGGTMALGYALRHPGTLSGVLVLSGFLPQHPDVRVTAETVAGTPIWWGHGTRDPAVRHEWAVDGRATLNAAGADLEARDYRMGHGITPEEWADAMAWMSTRLPG